MKDVFRRLAGLLGLDKPGDIPAGDQENLAEEDHYIRPDLEVRTKVIYPQNGQKQGSSHFRFPIIADEINPEKGSSHEPVQKQIMAKRIESKPINVESKIERVRNTDTKKPFRPSEIVSPVYGRLDMQNRLTQQKAMEESRYTSQQMPPINNYTSSTSSTSTDKNESFDVNSLDDEDHKPTVNSELLAAEKSFGDKTYEEGVPLFDDKTPLSEKVSPLVIDDKFSRVKQDDVVVSFSTFSTEDEIKLTEDTVFNAKQNKSVIELRQQELSNSSTESKASPLEPQQVEPEKQRAQDNVISFPTKFNANSGDNATDLALNQEIETKGNLSTAHNSDHGELQRSTVLHEARQNLDVPNMQHNTPPEIQQSSFSENYVFPYLNYLREEPYHSHDDDFYTDQQIEKLVVALDNFSVKADVIGVVKGPTVTRYELQPAPGVKVNKFTNLIDDIKLALAAKDIRMEAPIPGRSAIGIEVPNEVSLPVYIRSILDSEEFQQNPSPLSVALGRDISGEPVIGDLKKMPHGLIAGSTGSGKSVCVNSIIVSLLYKAKPEDVRMILIDPKVVELAPYNHIPHLLTPVVTDPKQATAALKWAVEEMDARYEKFADTGARDIERYNLIALREGREKLPYIVIIIDELADLMMVAPGDVEESICRIAQKARACGIHLLVATQRPSVDVITGLIKANIPTRVAFAVSSQADSRTILDMGGAERLLGKGDMLYYPSGTAKPIRLQGNFVSDDEIEKVIDHVKAQQKTVYLFDKEELSRASSSNAMENDDELFEEALLFVVEQGHASSSSLQRRFRIGYNRAARLVDMMENEGFISAQSGSKSRDVLLSIDEYRNLFG